MISPSRNPEASPGSNAPPNRWVMVASGFLLMFIFFGLLNAFGVFLKPLLKEFGWSRAMVSGAFSINLILQGLLGIIAGSLCDRYGPRRLVTLGVMVAGLGYILVSLTSALWHLYVFYGLIIGSGVAAIYSPVTSTVSRWFPGKRRGLALGVVTAGAGLGIMVMPPLSTFLITSFGWRWSFVILGLVSWAIAIPAALLLRPETSGTTPLGGSALEREARHTRINLQKTGFSAREAIVTLPFWLMLAAHIFHSIPRQTVMIHIVPDATDMGITPEVAATILTVIGAGNVIGRLAVGNLSDRIGSRRTLMLCFLLQSIAMFMLTRAGSLAAFYFVAGLYGIFSSGVMPTLVKLATEFFGLRSSGTIIGLWNAALTTGAGIGPFFAGFVFDVTESYSIAFLTGGVLLLAALALTIVARAPLTPRPAQGRAS